MLVVYGIFAAYAFGLLMNMSSWPFTLGIEVPGHTGGLSFVPGAPLQENLHRFGIYTLLTSTGSWDTGRAITNTRRADRPRPGRADHPAPRRTPRHRGARVQVSRSAGDRRSGNTPDNRDARGSDRSSLTSGTDEQDPVVLVGRVAAAVAVGRGHPEVPVRGDVRRSRIRP